MRGWRVRPHAGRCESAGGVNQCSDPSAVGIALSRSPVYQAGKKPGFHLMRAIRTGAPTPTGKARRDK